MTARWQRWLPSIALAVALVGCNFNLDDPTVVKTPRILAITADPPELAPGEEAEIRVMAFDPMGRELHYRFESCIDTSTFLGSDPSNGTGGMMAGMPPCVPLASTGNRGTLGAAQTQLIQTIIDAIPASSGFDPGFFRTVLVTAGLPLTVTVTVSAIDPVSGNEVTLVTGTKRVGVTTRAEPTTNPPYVFFRLGETEYLGGFDPADPFACIPWQSAPATFVASPETGAPDTVVLSPLDEPDTWTESFPIYDFSGEVRNGYEGAYYSWYATGGAMHTETTQWRAHSAEPSEIDATIRDNTWDVPRRPGTYDFWLVVRDGHLGEIGCRTTVEITARP